MGCLNDLAGKKNFQIQFKDGQSKDMSNGLITVISSGEDFEKWVEESIYNIHGRCLIMALCKRGEEHKRRRLAVEEARSGAEIEFKAYGYPITKILYFKYLGRGLSASD